MRIYLADTIKREQENPYNEALKVPSNFESYFYVLEKGGKDFNFDS